VKRRWLKLHLGVDATTDEIAAHVLTDGNADEAAQAPALLGRAEGTIASVIADGAYDGEPTYAAALARQRDPPPAVVIPPRASAVPSSDDPAKQGSRDRHIRLIAEHGRMGWQRATGYGRRSLGECAIGRYKRLIGPRLRARSPSGQQGEVALAVQALNRMIRTAKPVSVRIA
jgi:Transposase DDE domain